MLNRLADRVRLRTSTVAPTTPVRAVAPVAPRNFFVGEEVRAHVDSVQPKGIFKVLIDNQSFLLRLPFNAKSGDVIQLTVTAREPKLKFDAVEYPEPIAQATRLSDAARFITALLAESEKLPVAATALAGTPLLSGAPANGATLASALGAALAESGMFYESHQAQWVAGKYSLEMLLQEPQGRLSQSAGREPVTVPSVMDESDVNPGLSELPVHRDALAIVRQQLETLDTRHVAWRGLVWNDQPLEWHIAEHSPDVTAPPDEQQWQTRVSLALPRLGDVSATLLIGKRGVAIAIQTGSPDTASRLASHRVGLQQSLHAAGVNTLGITVNTDENA